MGGEPDKEELLYRFFFFFFWLYMVLTFVALKVAKPTFVGYKTYS